MDITSVKLILSGVFLITTFFCSAIPVCIFSWIKNRDKSKSTRYRFSLSSLNTFRSFVTCFGGGIFLGACLLDLLPEVTHHINMTLKAEFGYDDEVSTRYPIAELLIGCGIFLVLFIEQTILSCQSTSSYSKSFTNKKPTIILSHEDDDETSFVNDQDPLMVSSSTPEHRFDISEQKEDLVTNKNRVILTRNFILIISLTIHSIFEGIALGASKERKALIELFFAIFIHKSIIAFSVGLKLMNIPNKRRIYFACFLFSIAAPLGIFIVVSMQEFLPDNRTAKLVHEILSAFACGTFFYITFFDVLPHELNISTNHRHFSSGISNRYRLLKVFCIFIGFSFIAAMSYVMK